MEEHTTSPDNVAPEKNKPAEAQKGKMTVSITTLFLVVTLLIVLAGAGVGAYYYLDYLGRWISTNNAVVDGRIYTVSAELPGVLDSIVVDENRRVSKGDVLAELDSTMQDLAVRKIEASIEASNLAISALIKRPAIELELAQVEHRKLKLSLIEARHLRSKTVIVAPSDGYVTQQRMKEGEYVLPGQPLMSIANLDDLWITANFTEEQLKYIEPGQAVDIYLDAFPDEKLRGVVSSIMPASGAAFALFPPDATAGNWVRTTPRIPVRIDFSDNSPDGILGLRIGMLARVRVERQDRQ